MLDKSIKMCYNIGAMRERKPTKRRKDNKMKIAEEVVEKMVEAGANRWTKYGHDRLYLTDEQLGFKVRCYKTGSIAEAELNGEKISNSLAGDILSKNPYIDVNTGLVQVSYNGRGAQKAIELAQAFLDKFKNL